MKYAADFETKTVEPTSVWAWGLAPIDESETFYYGGEIESFLDFISTLKNAEIYFHNAAFDCEFIISWLLNNNYTWVKDRKMLTSGTFSTLISDMNQFYCMEINFFDGKKVKIIDSLKIIPIKIERVAKDFGLKIKKGEIDYTSHDGEKREITEIELDYLKNDVFILRDALKIIFGYNLTKMTLGSNALADFKEPIKNNRFKQLFPTPTEEQDKIWRLAYKGGFTYVADRYKGKDIGVGLVLDVNSLYPSVMYYNKMPYGKCIHREGKYKKFADYDLFIQEFWCEFELKENKIPTIQIKNTLAFCQTEYLKSSNTEIVHLFLTNVDMDLFFSHYNVYNIKWVQAWAWRSSETIFRTYIDKWMELKIEATKTGNKSLRTIAKLMLNNLYGKFALNPNVAQKKPYLDENGVVRYKLMDYEYRDPIYIPVGVFITSWARYKTITSAQKCYSRFIYADTDSLHLEGEEIPEGLEISDTDLGKWALEQTFTRARFLRQKSYIEEVNGELKVTVAGLPDSSRSQVTWENFHPDVEYTGKLTKSHVKGGIILKETTFKIRV